ncbi:hypothetical protein TNCV_3360331 [Trichonephila clavipes]|nr:hypothetical protein TNCV_3360331 [Trichonephila clavipes]
MGLQKFLFMDDNVPCHRTVAAEQLLESEDIERMDWLARSPDLNPSEHVWGFSRQMLGSSYLTTSNVSGLRLALQDTNGQQCLNNSLTPSFSACSRRCETLLAVRGDHIPKDRMFLAGHPSQDVSAFSRIALHATFQSSFFYPSDFSFSKCCLHYTCPYVLGILRY